MQDQQQQQFKLVWGGAVAAGGVFATLQAIGATGAIIAAAPYVAVGGGVLGAIGGIIMLI